MRWATYRSKDTAGRDERTGLVIGDAIHGLPAGVRLIDLLGDDGTKLREAAERARRTPAEIRPLGTAALLPPIPRPPTVRDCVSFEDHHRRGIEAVGQRWDDSYYEFPMFYFTTATALTGHDEVVRVPGNTRRMDFELEVCAIVGREGIDVDPAEAEQHVAGYAIFNDWSARDLQRDEMARAPIGPAKGKDSANSIGPFLVTPDELEDARQGHGFNLTMKAFVNGKLYSEGNWASVYWSFGEMLAYASRNAKLVPGDIIASGTVGTGCILEQSTTHGTERYPWLKEGDEVVLEVERLGRLGNRVTWAAEPKPIRGRITGKRALAT